MRAERIYLMWSKRREEKREEDCKCISNGIALI
jgi:hypothetical protein